jgi:hypothetical protein
MNELGWTDRTRYNLTTGMALGMDGVWEAVLRFMWRIVSELI